MKAVRVRWLDSASSYPDWTHKEDETPCPPCECTTVGYMIENTDYYIRLVQSIADWGTKNEQYNHSITIPKGCVTKITYLD